MTSRGVIGKTSMLASLAFMLTACSAGDGAAAGHAATVGQSPATGKQHPLTYYLDMETRAAGDRAIQVKQYQALVRNCKGMGAPVVPLSPSDIAKLSLTRTQTWKAPGRTAKQTDSWQMTTLKVAGSPIDAMREAMCHFTGVKKKSELTIWLDSGKVYSIDLTKGTGTVQSNAPGADPGRVPVASDEEAAAERRDEAAGFVKGSISSVAGQPCRMWTYRGGAGDPYSDCVWAGGQAWGYPATNEGGLVLSNKLEDGSYERAVTFVVGRLPDGGKIFHVPANVPIRGGTEPTVGRG